MAKKRKKSNKAAGKPSHKVGGPIKQDGVEDAVRILSFCAERRLPKLPWWTIKRKFFCEQRTKIFPFPPLHFVLTNFIAGDEESHIAGNSCHHCDGMFIAIKHLHDQICLHYQVKLPTACYHILGKVLCCDSLMTKEPTIHL